MSEFNHCEFLMYRWKNLLLWRNLWSILLYVLGAALAIMLTVMILFYVKQAWVSGVVSTLALVFNGIAVKWILARRTDSVTEEVEAKQDLLKHCSPAASGAALESMATTKPAPVDEAALKQIEDQHRLFGSFR